MAGGRGTPFADLPPGSIHIATAGNGRGFPGLFQVRRIFFDSFWDFIFHFLYKKPIATRHYLHFAPLTL